MLILKQSCPRSNINYIGDTNQVDKSVSERKYVIGDQATDVSMPRHDACNEICYCDGSSSQRRKSAKYTGHMPMISIF